PRAFTGELAIGLGLFRQLLFEDRVGRLFRHLLELKRVLEIFGNHLHASPPACPNDGTGLRKSLVQTTIGFATGRLRLISTNPATVTPMVTAAVADQICV